MTISKTPASRDKPRSRRPSLSAAEHGSIVGTRISTVQGGVGGKKKFDALSHPAKKFRLDPGSRARGVPSTNSQWHHRMRRQATAWWIVALISPPSFPVMANESNCMAFLCNSAQPTAMHVSSLGSLQSTTYFTTKAHLPRRNRVSGAPSLDPQETRFVEPDQKRAALVEFCHCFCGICLVANNYHLDPAAFLHVVCI